MSGTMAAPRELGRGTRHPTKEVCMDQDRYRKIGAAMLALGGCMLVFGLAGRRSLLLVALVFFALATLMFLRWRRS